MPRSKTGKMTIKPNKISYRILKWMQDNPNQLKKTTGHQISASVANLDDVTSGEVGIAQVLSKMIRCNVVYRDKYDRSIFSDFRINYWHKSIPADILAGAPAEVKRAMAKTIDDMKPGQYMDDEGCVVTPNAVDKVEDPFNEDKTVESEPGTFDNPIVEDQCPWEEDGEDDEEEGTTTIPLQITKEKDGKTTNVTINLTINI